MNTSDPLPEPVDFEVVLASFVVMARLPQQAEDEQQALLQARGQLEPVADLYDHVMVERVDPDGTVMVVARFVTVALDVSDAVNGVYAQLSEVGVPVDECWVPVTP